MTDMAREVLAIWWVQKFGVALLILIGGLIVARLSGRLAATVARKRLTAQHGMLLRRGIAYLASLTAVFATLDHLGVDLGLLLGAAGILTVAIGFAAQTSASNAISGIFLIAERPFVIGESITVGMTTGEVLSIDLLSVKLRTFDNLYVRVPNETLIKSEITNLSRFPIRRFDFMVTVSLEADLKHVEDVLVEVSSNHPLCLEEPKPDVIVTGFGDSSVIVRFSTWTTRENYTAVRQTIPRAVKDAFAAAGIVIPVPHRRYLSD